MTSPAPSYRGRVAPSPTGLLHVGHGRTFWIAQSRAREAGGTLVLRNEDLDPDRCRPEFATAMLADLHWLGLDWAEGPDVGGPYGPYQQSLCFDHYRNMLRRLQEKALIYPCHCSRRDIRQAVTAPHAGDEEPIYPGTCRPTIRSVNPENPPQAFRDVPGTQLGNRSPNWRFRVPDGKSIKFVDANLGPQEFVAGQDFGDFVVWRHDDVPAYQLAVVADDCRMKITEVVRGADLLVSTARQLLLYEALGEPWPTFYHCPLVVDDQGNRLAKRHDSLSLRSLREQGKTPEEIRGTWR